MANRSRRCFSGVALILMVLGTALARVTFADDWPQWRGIHRDGRSAETGLLQTWSEGGPPLKWSVEGLGRGYSSPIVSQGRLYVTGMAQDSDEGFLFAFDLKGRRLWKQPLGVDWGGMYPGSRGCPTVDGDRLYLLSGTGTLFCLDAASGKETWTKNLVDDLGGEAPRCGFVEGPFVTQKLVVCTPGGPRGTFAGLDKATGEVVWKSESIGDVSAYCSPIAVARGKGMQLITMTSRHVVGYEPHQGAILWKHPFDYDEELQNHSDTPIHHNGIVYVTSGHRKGGMALELTAEEASVKVKWTDEVLNPNHGGVVLVDGRIYGANGRGYWICLELATGRVLGEVKGASPGSLIYADGRLYCYGEKGVLALAKPMPAGIEWVSQFRIEEGEGPHWAHPVISDKVLYIRHGDVLMAFDIAAR